MYILYSYVYTAAVVKLPLKTVSQPWISLRLLYVYIHIHVCMYSYALYK